MKYGLEDKSIIKPVSQGEAVVDYHYPTGASDIQEALLLHQQGQLDQAQSIYKRLLDIDPRNPDALHLIGVIASQTGNHEVAVEMISQAIGINPNVASYYSNRGNALKELKQLEAAVESCDMAICLNPNYVKAYFNRGNALKELRQLTAALSSYDIAICLNPDYAEAYSNRGNVLQEIKKLDLAIASFEKAIALQPNYATAYFNRGNALLELKQLDTAIASYNNAISINPNYADAYYNRGVALQEQRQLDAALVSYDKAISLKPDYEYLSGMSQHAKMDLCNWQDFDRNVLEISDKIKKNLKASTCLPVLALPISLSEQRQAAEIWSADKYPYNPSLGSIPKAIRQSKIRIGYYSADFRVHPVSILTVGLFELHDKSKFELIAFAFGPDSQDEIRGRITSAFDKFIDVRAKSDQEVAVLSRTLGIDIAIDLGGHTQDCRTGIFSFRAAPIQLSYIGYLGTMGASYYDYLIADQTLIPQKYQPFYSEKIIYLPFYQVNDSKQQVPRKALSREFLNLPKSGFVYCCFNSNYKITPTTFDGWMRILKSVPQSVLLLYTGIKSAEENLKLEAEKRGVNPERLVFGGRLPRSEYLARCQSADLFLDTLPYNAGATASDALWAGLPVLTCMGESFASRYAASLLNAIGLHELITQTQAEYEALAIELASNPIRLKEIKDKLQRHRLTTPLFDTALFTKHIETAYTKIYERYRADLPPDHIFIDN
jgi:predicted O-linked N-acetylglucosamine transferase (SPINDLY family)